MLPSLMPVIIITTREAIRAVPSEIRFGSLALGATQWQTTWRQTLPSAIPGIAILVTVLAVSLVGQGLNDALNPRLKGR